MARLSDLVRAQSPDSFHRFVTPPRGSVNVVPDAVDSSTRWYADTKQELGRVRDAIRTNGQLRLDKCRDLAATLVAELQQTDDCVRWALRGVTEDYALDNALNVAVIGVKIGMGLQYAHDDLVRLALGGLVHDVGMWTLPDSVLERRGVLTDDQMESVRAHPELGRRLLADLGPLYHQLSTVIAQEHERWDGSGYPCRLKGLQISEEAQVIGLADVFDALVTPRPHKKHIPPHHALRELLVHGKPLFAHRVLKALGDQVTLYPVGTPVRLNTGEIGTVMRVNPRYPLRPILMIDRKAAATTGAARGELDLGHTATVHIVEVLQSASTS